MKTLLHLSNFQKSAFLEKRKLDRAFLNVSCESGYMSIFLLTQLTCETIESIFLLNAPCHEKTVCYVLQKNNYKLQFVL